MKPCFHGLGHHHIANAQGFGNVAHQGREERLPGEGGCALNHLAQLGFDVVAFLQLSLQLLVDGSLLDGNRDWVVRLRSTSISSGCQSRGRVLSATLSRPHNSSPQNSGSITLARVWRRVSNSRWQSAISVA